MNPHLHPISEERGRGLARTPCRALITCWRVWAAQSAVCSCFLRASCSSWITRCFVNFLAFSRRFGWVFILFEDIGYAQGLLLYSSLLFSFLVQTRRADGTEEFFLRVIVRVMNLKELRECIYLSPWWETCKLTFTCKKVFNSDRSEVVSVAGVKDWDLVVNGAPFRFCFTLASAGTVCHGRAPH